MTDASLEEAIRKDPDRFMTDMDLRDVFDKVSFDKEIEKARLRCRRSYANVCDKWMRHSTVLFETGRVQQLMVRNIETNEVTLKKRHKRTGEFVTIRGYDMGDGTFLMTKEMKGVSGKKFKMVVRRKHKI